MKRWFVILLLAVIFAAATLVTGCGPKQETEQKSMVIKPTGTVAENADETDTEEEVESQGLPESGAAGPAKTVTESAIDKAATIQEAQAEYQAAEAPKAETPKIETPKVVEELVVANFDSGEKPNNLGGNFGAWNKDPSDPTQWCKESFDNVTRHGNSSFSMKLDYSVDSPNPAYNGFWMMLPNLDASKYDALNFWVKGDAKAGYTTVFKIELKNANKQVGRYYVSNVSDQWQEISIPLSELKGLIDRSNLTEFVVVFEDRMASNKKGVIYIDDIRFIKK